MRLMHKVWVWLLAPYPGYTADGRSLPWRVFGRVIRPFSFAVSLATAVLTVGIVTNQTVGVSLDGVAGHLIGVAAAASTVLMWWGWWGRSVWAMTQGLLVSAGVWAAAGAAILFEGASWVSGCVALCWAIASAGSWILEVNDPNVKGG